MSFCCCVDGCRTRATPPSLRFLGRKVYLATIVVLVAIMREGTTDARMRQLTAVIGVDRLAGMVGFWQIARAAFLPPVDQDRLRGR